MLTPTTHTVHPCLVKTHSKREMPRRWDLFMILPSAGFRLADSRRRRRARARRVRNTADGALRLHPKGLVFAYWFVRGQIRLSLFPAPPTGSQTWDLTGERQFPCGEVMLPRHHSSGTEGRHAFTAVHQSYYYLRGSRRFFFSTHSCGGWLCVARDVSGERGNPRS